MLMFGLVLSASPTLAGEWVLGGAHETFQLVGGSEVCETGGVAQAGETARDGCVDLTQAGCLRCQQRWDVVSAV